MSTEQKITPHLLNILALTKKVGTFRAGIISFIFPEFRDILGELSDIGAVVDAQPK